MRANIGHLADVGAPGRRQARSMNQDTNSAGEGTSASGVAGAAQRPAELARRFPGTDMPIGLVLALVAIGLPRTILADLDIVEPESGFLYYVLALTPFAVWLGVAVMRRSRRPFVDFVIVGLLYGLSLVVVHQVLWDAGPSLGHHPPASAVDFANRFDGWGRELALRAYTSGVAMVIGLGTGLVTALVALGVHRLRSGREAKDGQHDPTS
jgi:hypothetical protein